MISSAGYEEAAAQGLVAGINAALAFRDCESWMPNRSEAYLGVLIDNLVTRDTREPYRTITSRAEHRLLLRERNADMRLTPTGFDLGLIEEERWRLFEAKQQLSDAETERLREVRVHPRDVPAECQQPEARRMSARCGYQAGHGVPRTGVSTRTA